MTSLSCVPPVCPPMSCVLLHPAPPCPLSHVSAMSPLCPIAPLCPMYLLCPMSSTMSPCSPRMTLVSRVPLHPMSTSPLSLPRPPMPHVPPCPTSPVPPLTCARYWPSAGAKGRVPVPVTPASSSWARLRPGRAASSRSSAAGPSPLYDKLRVCSRAAPAGHSRDSGVAVGGRWGGSAVAVGYRRLPVSRVKAWLKPQACRRSAVRTGQQRRSSASGWQPPSPRGFRLRSSSCRLCLGTRRGEGGDSEV